MVIGQQASFMQVRGGSTEQVNYSFANRQVQQSATGARRFSFYGRPQTLKDFSATFRVAGKDREKIEMMLMNATYNVNALSSYYPLTIFPAGAQVENLLTERDSMMLPASVVGNAVLAGGDFDENDRTVFYRDLYTIKSPVKIVDNHPMPFGRQEYNFSAVLSPGSSIQITWKMHGNKDATYTLSSGVEDGLFPHRKSIWFVPENTPINISVTAVKGDVGYPALTTGREIKPWAAGKCIQNVALTELSSQKLRGMPGLPPIYEYQCKFIEVGAGRGKVV
jgi:hypothetical protein|nr:MAG TPA: hypothetical protein [Caudoviricetes sp.]